MTGFQGSRHKLLELTGAVGDAAAKPHMMRRRKQPHEAGVGECVGRQVGE